VEHEIYRWLGILTSIRSDVLAPLGLALAVVVTVHALMNKREVGAAIGWIGLAWLSPLLGSTLYVMFGINRVSRRARKLPVLPGPRPGAPPPPVAEVPDAFQPLKRAVERISGLPLVAGNRIQRFRHGDEAYPAMLAAIGEAQTSVALSSYIMRDDDSGRAFAAALAAA
jgi:cardiolipin synthase